MADVGFDVWAVGIRQPAPCRAEPGALRSGFKFAFWERDLTSPEDYAVTISKGCTHGRATARNRRAPLRSPAAARRRPIPEAAIDLSVVIPIFDEQDNLSLLHQRLIEVLGSLGRSYELIFVDDGSTDGSVRICRELADDDDHTVVVELRRHFGKATALQAGFQVARGRVIITMDGDLQDDPKEIPAFLSALTEDVDLVSGWKRNCQDPLSKTLPSRIFNAITSFVSGIPLRDFNCGFKAYRAEVVRQLDLYGEIYRFIPVLAHAKGYHVAEIPVDHQPRRYGASKYSFERFLRGAFDLLTVMFLCRFQSGRCICLAWLACFSF